MSVILRLALSALLACGDRAQPGGHDTAQPGFPLKIRLERVGDEFQNPVYVTSPPGDCMSRLNSEVVETYWTSTETD